MDSISAVMMGMASRGNEPKVIDWEKAAKLIAEHEPKNASAGLIEDWFWTGGSILKNGKPVASRAWLSSTWATPTLVFDDTNQTFPCYTMLSEAKHKWDDGDELLWPKEALKILGVKTKKKAVKKKAVKKAVKKPVKKGTKKARGRRG